MVMSSTATPQMVSHHNTACMNLNRFFPSFLLPAVRHVSVWDHQPMN
jgi:hypothetical protein